SPASHRSRRPAAAPQGRADGACHGPREGPIEAQTPQTCPSYLTNNEAAAFLRLSPRTLEKQRVIGGGPRFHTFGQRVMYALTDLEAWASEPSFETTFDL